VLDYIALLLVDANLWRFYYVVAGASIYLLNAVSSFHHSGL